MHIKLNLYQGGLIRAAYTGCSLRTLTTAKGPVSNSPNLVLESQGSPREQSVFSLHQNPKEVGSNTPKGMGSGTRWMNLPGRVRASRQKSMASFVLLFGLPPEDVTPMKMVLLTSGNLDIRWVFYLR